MRSRLLLAALLTLTAVSGTISTSIKPASAAMITTTCATQPTPSTVSATTYKDIAYSPLGKGNATSLDVYTTNKSSAHPVVLFIHGGGWSIGDKKNDSSKSEGFTAAGYVYITINYRLVPRVQYPDNIQDVADAIAWTYRNISTYGGDPNCIFVMGHSAGAHLAALVSTDEQFLKADRLDLSIIRGTIALDTASYDLRSKASGKNTSEESVQAAFGNDPTVWDAASPANHVTAGKAIPPMLLVYVARRPDSKAASLAMQSLLTSAGIPAEVYAAQGKTHETLNKELGQSGDAPTQVVLQFIKAQIAS